MISGFDEILFLIFQRLQEVFAKKRFLPEVHLWTLTRASKYFDILLIYSVYSEFLRLEKEHWFCPYFFWKFLTYRLFNKKHSSRNTHGFLERSQYQLILSQPNKSSLGYLVRVHDGYGYSKKDHPNTSVGKLVSGEQIIKHC